MIKSLLATFVSLAAFSTIVEAQLPEYTGELLLRPSINDNKCLTASALHDGAPVVISTCTGAASQKWVFTGNNGLVQTANNMCLDVTDGVNADGTKLQVWTCSPGNPNQNWWYDKWSNTLSWTDRWRCLDVTDGIQDDGNQVQVWGCWDKNPNQIWSTGYMPNALPYQSQNGQYGTNQCGGGNDQNSNCQTSWINSATDFCLWGPPWHGPVGNTERVAVAYCTKNGRGTRSIPDGTLTGVHFVRTPEYVQITGTGDFTNLNIPAGDDGGELDNKGADGKGNPIGGLLFGNTFVNGLQYNEWTQFISDREFCIRACIGPRAKQLCNHIYDVMGCWWNMPANYNSGVFEECEGDPATPMGVYDGTSTWYQGVSPTPPPHPAPASSNCVTLPTVGVSDMLRRRGVDSVGGFETRKVPEFPGATPAPVAR
ncbi:macrofage activating glycoprotein [Coprinopsis cinerea okayama7|uniref:Macrofage activating glycoprotein n=1 Tax=Coprinopsis cinerea (strain Okayama-7 / 130 / ATCC MYA-4618 / FGSC 9003) TaxID=240176 RepID=A8NVL8_COPC7|nr:macrofage activating glycoprotein [Coprinopsis cinerea okayama7\|eukprot:XP_001836681.1 macrofage activating glycoprotein [Coprinopsis cinerea okayama7\